MAERAAKKDRVLGMLFLTRRCNLACRYCHMARPRKAGGSADAERATLQAGVDLLFRSFDRLELQFFGGEPLLRLDLLSWCVDYVRSRWPDRPPTHFLVTTNGLLLEGAVLEALLERDVNLMLSLDGTFASQRDLRVGAGDGQRAYDHIAANMRELRRRGIPFFVNAVVSPRNVDRLEDNLAALLDLGATTVQFAYELGTLWQPEDRKRYIDGLLRLKARYQGSQKVRIQNSWESEPVLGSSFFVVDVSGELYHGCAIVLEKSMPRFNRATRVGDVASVGSLGEVRRGMVEQLLHVRRGTRDSAEEWRRLRSNLLLGLELRRQLRKAQEKTQKKAELST